MKEWNRMECISWSH